ncbi:MAG: hypothetical protein R2681_04275 [Pyrinomonadaceae bacterium]
MKTITLKLIIGLFVFNLLANFGAGQSPEDFKGSQESEKQAYENYKAGRLPDFLENMRKANALRQNHPRLIYNLSVALALNGKAEDALLSLERLAEMGLFFSLEKDDDLKSLFELERFPALKNRFGKNKDPLKISTKLFSIPDKTLITEGIAYDPESRRHFVSSVHQRKIVAVDEKGMVRDFSSEADGLWSVLGMRVDPARSILWASSAAFPQMRGFEESENGKSAVFKYDLKSGKLLKKYVVSGEGEKHALGDLVIDGSGNVYASDSISPKIYRIGTEKDEIEVFIESEMFASLQGLALSPDGKWMFAADYSKGIFRIDMDSKDIVQLIPAPNITVLGIDGLYYYSGDLIGIQNGVTPQRVFRLHLDDAKSKIDRFQTLEANHENFNEPTLGVVVGDNFHFVANSQWSLVNNKGELAEEKLQEPVILNLKLSR